MGGRRLPGLSRLAVAAAGGGRREGSAQALTFLEASAFQFLNPKAWVSTLTAATLFLPHELGPVIAAGYMLLWGVLIPAPSLLVWALFGTSLRAVLARPRGRVAFNSAMALALGVTAVMMVI